MGRVTAVSQRSVIRWGIVGAGRVADGFADGLLALADAELTAVTSRRPESASRFAARHGVRRVHPSLAELVIDREIDIVYIATPNHRHMDDALACIEHGKAVVCEKPFTTNADEARRVIDAAREHRVFCMEAMWMRFVPSIQRVATLVADGAIGPPRLVQADFSVANSYDARSRLFDPQQGGGALLDLGVYPISLAVMLLGSPERVVSHRVPAPSGVDEQSGIVLGHAGGAMSVLSCSLSTFGANQATVSGTRGTIRIDGPICAPKRIVVTNWTAATPASDETQQGVLESFVRSRPAVARSARAARNILARATRRGPRSIHFTFERNGYEYEAAEAMRCLRAGELESPTMPLDETLRIMEVMDEVRAGWNRRPISSPIEG